MKKNKFQEIKNKPEIELQKDLLEHRERLQTLRFDLASGKTKGIKDIRNEKKDIAQILTLIRSKKIS